MIRTFERIFGRFAVPHLTIILVVGKAMFYFAIVANEAIADRCVLVPALVMQGEFWRPFSFIFMPESRHPIWIFFELYFLWLMGTALENHWGRVRYNLYFWLGVVLTIAAAFLNPNAATYNTALMASIFLAFAFLYPDFEILLFLILPVKVKWLALITWVLFGVRFLMPGAGWETRIAIIASLANFFIFFGKDIVDMIRRRHGNLVRRVADIERTDFHMHQCSVCGKTENSDPEAEFRYWHDGDDTKCFCLDHLPDDAL